MLYDLQRIINGFVAFAPLNIYDRTNAAVPLYAPSQLRFLPLRTQVMRQKTG